MTIITVRNLNKKKLLVIIWCHSCLVGRKPRPYLFVADGKRDSGPDYRHPFSVAMNFQDKLEPL